jgi:uncharacterized membrane protein (UPF0127 family)
LECFSKSGSQSCPARGIVPFYNGKGTAEQWIKQGKYALNWTRFSCHNFVVNQVRLRLFILVYSLGNLMRRLALLEGIKHCALANIKAGGRLACHTRSLVFQPAEVLVIGEMLTGILEQLRSTSPEQRGWQLTCPGCCFIVRTVQRIPYSVNQFDPANSVEMSITYIIWLFMALLLLIATLACGGAAAEVVTPPPGPDATPTPTTVTIGDASFAVELAVTPQQQAQGLSGRPGLAPGTGMLFIFESESLHSFWMKDMRFPLDMVWISAEYAVVDITEDVSPPAPSQTTSDLPKYMPAEPAQYVMEINAGEAESADIGIGDMVEFGGFHLVK